MYREITQELVKWKEDRRRKPLMVTGVRQCGKTYVLKKLGERYFFETCYINFESKSAVISVMEY